MSEARVKAQLIPIEELFHFPENPNSQSLHIFGELTAEIAEDGFSEPLTVIPKYKLEPGAPGYVVVSGNHRLDAVKKLGYTAVDCVVQDWDADTARIKVVRRNLIKGETDPAKFVKLVDSINGYTHDQISEAMGFRDIEAFSEMYAAEKDFGGYGSPVATPVENVFDGLSTILNRLFVEYGDSIPYSYMFFLYGSKPHLTVLANNNLKQFLNVLVKLSNKNNIDINALFTAVLNKGLENIDLDDQELIDSLSKNEEQEGQDPWIHIKSK